MGCSAGDEESNDTHIHHSLFFFFNIYLFGYVAP